MGGPCCLFCRQIVCFHGCTGVSLRDTPFFALPISQGHPLQCTEKPLAGKVLFASINALRENTCDPDRWGWYCGEMKKILMLLSLLLATAHAQTWTLTDNPQIAYMQWEGSKSISYIIWLPQVALGDEFAFHSSLQRDTNSIYGSCNNYRYLGGLAGKHRAWAHQKIRQSVQQRLRLQPLQGFPA